MNKMNQLFHDPRARIKYSRIQIRSHKLNSSFDLIFENVLKEPSTTLRDKNEKWYQVIIILLLKLAQFLRLFPKLFDC